jgi:YHS domain-containing protein
MKKQRLRLDSHKDPVCGQRINRNKAHIVIEYEGQTFLLCCPLCQSEFEKDPQKYVR